MTNTPNYNLGIPDATDPFKDFRQLFDDNMNIIDNGLGNKNIADEYDDTSTYNVDEYVIYKGVLYKCTTAVTVAEPFDNTKWTAVLVTDEMGGGGGSGHTILDESGNTLPNRTKLQFTDGLQASDDNVNGKTVVSLAYFAVIGGELCQVYDDGN